MGGCVLTPPPPPPVPPEVPPELVLDPPELTLPELAVPADELATTTVRVMTSGGGGATGEYRRMVSPLSGMAGTAVVSLVGTVLGVVVGSGASAFDVSGARD